MNLSTSTHGMRGLSQYISDIRACTTREAEEKTVNRELVHIRQKFHNVSNLDGYQRKKYVAKIIFTYMQGYRVDIGHLEAVNLVTSTRYSEKQIVRRVASQCTHNVGLFGAHAADARELGPCAPRD